MRTGDSGNAPRSSGSRKQILRVDHLRYWDPDDYECSVCGARFQKKNTLICPSCGVHFTGTKEDDSIEEEELDEKHEWDEEDEEP